MKKLNVLMMLGVAAVAGCDVQAQSESQKRHDLGRIREVCIDGIVYLIYSGHKEGGITPKINAEHYPYTCNQAIN